jgi:hypothetical protein
LVAVDGLMVGIVQSAGLLWRKSKVGESLAGAHFSGAVVGSIWRMTSRYLV